jgi:hypothetical protein
VRFRLNVKAGSFFTENKNKMKNIFNRIFWVSLSTPDYGTAKRALIVFPFKKFNFVAFRWSAGKGKNFENFLEKLGVYIAY